MNMVLEAIPVPLRDDGEGSLRVGQTRVRLESVLACHKRGETPEQIAEAFDTLELADVYAVITWALRHPVEVQAYLERRETEALELRQEAEALGLARTSQESERFRQSLTARLTRGQGAADAPPTH